MGISSNGILVFGIAYEEDENDFPWASCDFEEWYSREVCGVKEADFERCDDYWDARRAAAKSAPVDLVLHCMYDYPMYILAPRNTFVSNSRGFPKEIDVTAYSLEKQAAWRKVLQEFCETHGIFFKEPKLWLCSLMG